MGQSRQLGFFSTDCTQGVCLNTEKFDFDYMPDYAHEDYSMFAFVPKEWSNVNVVKIDGSIRPLGENLGFFEDVPAMMLTQDDTNLEVFKIDQTSDDFEAHDASGILGLGPATHFGNDEKTGWNIMY